MPSPDPAASSKKKTIVTEEALYVSPDIVGLPLARPWRRLAAISVDGALVALLSNSPSVLFGLAAAYVLFRVSARGKAGAGYIRRSFRFMFRLGGAMVLFGVAVSLWGMIADRFEGGEDGEQSVRASLSVDDEGNVRRDLSLTGMQAVRFGSEVVELHTAEDEAEARAAVTGLLGRMRGGGLSGAEARAAVRDLVVDVEDKPWLMPAVETVLREDEAIDRGGEVAATEDSVDLLDPDTLLVHYAAAVTARDSAAIDSLRPGVVALLSADTVGVLASSITALDDERDDLRRQVEELEEEVEEGPGMLAVLRSFANDLGLGFGWFGLYFTATTAMWQGRTPGKRLFGIRVISLTGKPIGWWAAFERFGGYAAGFATGLLGFLQILWDDNRQAIHDKIAVTAVIREGQTPQR